MFQNMNYKNIQNVNNQYVKFKIPFLKDSYLIKWKPYSRTIIHNHDNKKCDFIVFQYKLHECLYTKKHLNSLYLSREIEPLKKYTVEKDVYHQMLNLDKKEIWSYHKYY